MAETYLITAKTVEEAVSVAKREYEDARHEVSYEIVEMPKKGFLGLGAKPAKIKVTVSKVMTVQSELGSLVADIKNMKNLTDREGAKEQKEPEAKKPRAEAPETKPQQPKQNQQKQGQNQNQNGQQKQKQNPPQNQQNQQKQKQQGQKQQPAQNQKEQPEQHGQPQQNPPKQGQNQKQQQGGAKQNQNQPKQQNQKEQPKQNQPAKEQQKKQSPAPKAEEAPAVTPAPAAAVPAAVTEPEVPVSAEEPLAAAETGTAFGESAGYRSALGNQAKPQRRNRQRKSAKSAEESVSASGVTVSAPVGLTDFVSEPAAEGAFGQGQTADEHAFGNRMNNDVRRKNRQSQNQPKAAAKPAEVPDIAEPEAPAQSQSRGQRQRNRRPANIQKAVNESLASRYDIAETDEDYEKLDRLTAESASAEPIRIPASSEAPKSEEPPADRKREAITREEMDYALEFANTLLRNMQLDARAVPAECPEGEEYVVTETADVYPKIDIIGSETGILIGHHGETLDAIQYLVNLSALRKTKSRDGDYVKIVVDIENYREKREETLRTLARRMAARAVRYKRNVFLEPMNAYERRIIHSELQSFENVSTHSVGADRDRKIIITYEGPEKSDLQPQSQSQSQSRRRRRGEGEDSAESEGGRRRRGAYAESGEPEAVEKRDRRPRKLNKMPIEQLTEWLPDAVTDSESESGEADGGDVLHVMSGLRETFAESAETVEEAEEAVEETVEETEEDLTAEAVEDAAETVEDAAETAEDAVEEAVEDAEKAAAEPVESFEEKAQALADILDSIADPAPDNGENE